VFTGNYPLDLLEVSASITFRPAILDAAATSGETTSGLATQNWKFWLAAATSGFRPAPA
jgi:hypothetical protein